MFTQQNPDFGFTEAYWNVADVKDGEYEISLYAKCVSSGMASPPPGLDDYRSLVIAGSIDRDLPIRFGYTKPVTGIYTPGDDITVSFNEDINCKTPFTFTIDFELMSSKTNEKINVIDPMNVVCYERDLILAFSTSLPVSSRKVVRIVE
jgi:hypothetical protein